MARERNVRTIKKDEYEKIEAIMRKNSIPSKLCGEIFKELPNIDRTFIFKCYSTPSTLKGLRDNVSLNLVNSLSIFKLRTMIELYLKYNSTIEFSHGKFLYNYFGALYQKANVGGYIVKCNKSRTSHTVLDLSFIANRAELPLNMSSLISSIIESVGSQSKQPITKDAFVNLVWEQLISTSEFKDYTSKISYIDQIINFLSEAEISKQVQGIIGMVKRSHPSHINPVVKRACHEFCLSIIHQSPNINASVLIFLKHTINTFFGVAADYVDKRIVDTAISYKEKYLEEIKNREELDTIIEHTLNNTTSSEKKIEAPEKFLKPCDTNFEFASEDDSYGQLDDDTEGGSVPDGAVCRRVVDDVIPPSGHMKCGNCIAFNQNKNRCTKYHIPVSNNGVCDFFQMSEEMVKKLINYREEI